MKKRGKREIEEGQQQLATVKDLSRLPIFLLEGGTEERRNNLVRRLMAELTANNLGGVYVRQGAGNTLHGLTILAQRHDLVLVNEAIDNPMRAMRLQPFTQSETDESSWSLNCEEEWPEVVAGILERLEFCAKKTPVWGCVLIGGKSLRMGRPKHLLVDPTGKTWLERTVDTLQAQLDGVVIAGQGEVGKELSTVPRLIDIPGVSGPLAGLLAAGRWQPLVSWLLVGCDMPYITAEAVAWLTEARHAGWWGCVPKLSGEERFEPLFAWYDFRAMHLFEEQVLQGSLRLSDTAGDFRMEHPTVPEELRHCWQNINTPEELSLVQW